MHISSLANLRVVVVLASVASVLETFVVGAMAASPTIHDFCVRYAGHATSESLVAEKLHCRTNGPPVWSTDNSFHLKWCLSQFPDTFLNEPSPPQELNGKNAANILEQTRIAMLQDCQAHPPATGVTLKVVAEVTMYDTYQDGNHDRCYLHPGDTLAKLSPDGAVAPWMHLKGNSGDCSGKTGYVYNNGELQ